jgi:glycosyltransferase involved in cell wall biosynthesis
MTPQRRRLLFVGAHPKANGSNIAASHELALRLRTSGWNTQVVSMHAHPVGRLVEQVRAVLRAAPATTLVLLDVFSGRALSWARVAAAVCRARKVPYAAILHGGGLADLATKSPQLLEPLLCGAESTITPSPWLARTVAERLVRPIVIPNGIDLSGYTWRERRALAPEILWLRALHPIYRPELAIQTVALLRRAGVPARLTMVGPDKAGLRPQLERKIRAAQLEKFVRIVGPVPKAEIPQWLDRADILLNTTDVDNAPVSLVEALACGVPVVSTDAGGIPDLLRSEDHGVLVPCGSAEAMARAIEGLVNHPDHAASLSVAGRRLAAHFDWAVVDAQWGALLADLAGEVRP